MSKSSIKLDQGVISLRASTPFSQKLLRIAGLYPENMVAPGWLVETGNPVVSRRFQNKM